MSAPLIVISHFPLSAHKEVERLWDWALGIWDEFTVLWRGPGPGSLPHAISRAEAERMNKGSQWHLWERVFLAELWSEGGEFEVQGVGGCDPRHGIPWAFVREELAVNEQTLRHVVDWVYLSYGRRPAQFLENWLDAPVDVALPPFMDLDAVYLFHVRKRTPVAVPARH